jgi:CBS domain-containing protein
MPMIKEKQTDDKAELLNRERRAQISRFAGALTFVALGLLIIWFTKAVIGVTGDALFVAELFVAVLVFLILSGQISEFTAGGVTAKFRELADERLTPENAPTIEAEEAVIIRKGPVEALRRLRRQGVDEGRALILSLTLGGSLRGARRSRYDREAIREYLQTLAGFGRFRFVVFVQPDGRLIGYVRQEVLAQALEDPRVGDQLIRAINAGDEVRVLSLPGIMTTPLTTRTSNAEALDRMAELNLEAMVVVDGDTRPVGFIERERLSSQMLAAIARG